MAEFVKTMKDWRRMCNTIQSENQRRSTGAWCKGCPLQGLCIIDTSIKDSTNGEFGIIGEQIQAWAADHQEPVYPTWLEWLKSMGVIPYLMGLVTVRDVDGTFDDGHVNITENALKEIPADIAEKLGLQPKEV